MKRYLAALSVGAALVLPFAVSAQSYVTPQMWGGGSQYGNTGMQYGSSYASNSYSYNQQQMYWCNGYYSYSPCQQQHQQMYWCNGSWQYGPCNYNQYQQHYQLYWCNGYYSYSPCQQYYYYYPYYDSWDPYGYDNSYYYDYSGW